METVEIFEICVSLGFLLFMMICKFKWMKEDLNYYKERSEQYEEHYHNLLCARVENGYK